MKVSACIITYNQEDYITECLESALSQIVDFEYEIVIGEDKSTDGTLEICKKFALKYPNKVRLIEREKNLGMAGNWMNTMSSCSGKYIAICEGDDYWTDPLKLQKQVDFLEENPGYVITYGKIQPFNEYGLLYKKYGAERDLSGEKLIKCTGINTLTVCFRNIIKEYPKEMLLSGYGDLFLWSLLGHYGAGKFMEEIKPSMYRLHEGGVFSMQNTKRRKEMWLKTSFALYLYYIRIDKKAFANYFIEKHIKAGIDLVGKRVLLKIMIIRVVLKMKLLFKLVGNFSKNVK